MIAICLKCCFATVFPIYYFDWGGMEKLVEKVVILQFLA